MKIKMTVFILIAVLSFTKTALCAAETMIFWYPGEAGTTQEAQPILDTFLDYVSSKAQTVKLSGKYFNTTDEGLAFINRQKPAIGIVSYFAWESNKGNFRNSKVWLATNPTPHGQKQESYTLVGKGSLPGGNVTVFSSEPLGKDFIKNKLAFAQLKDFTPQSTAQLLFKLKSIAEGSVSAVAILSPTEAVTFQKMSAPWTKSLQVLAKSAVVPTARVVIFNPPLKDEVNLKNALLNLKSDPQAKDILEEMRLVGFSEP